MHNNSLINLKVNIQGIVSDSISNTLGATRHKLFGRNYTHKDSQAKENLCDPPTSP